MFIFLLLFFSSVHSARFGVSLKNFSTLSKQNTKPMYKASSFVFNKKSYLFHFNLNWFRIMKFSIFELMANPCVVLNIEDLQNSTIGGSFKIDFPLPYGTSCGLYADLDIRLYFGIFAPNLLSFDYNRAGFFFRFRIIKNLICQIFFDAFKIRNDLIAKKITTDTLLKGLSVHFDYNFQSFENSFEAYKNNMQTEFDYSLAQTLEKQEGSQYFYNKISEDMIGQEKEKQIFSTVIHSHLEKLAHKKESNKANLLIIGPSGTGKTFMLEKLKQILPNVPIGFTDITRYKPEKIDDVLQCVYGASNNDIELAEKAILFIDEIDKATPEQQNALLTLVNGKECMVSVFKTVYGGDVMVPMKSHNILFICAGAFDKVPYTIDERVKNNPNDVAAGDINNQDLIHVMKRELLGRLPYRICLKPFSQEEMFKIIKNSKVIENYIWLFKKQGINLEITDEGITAVAKLCKEKNLSARELNVEFSKILDNYLFDVKKYSGFDLIFDGNTVKTRKLKQIKIQEKIVELNEKNDL